MGKKTLFKGKLAKTMTPRRSIGLLMPTSEIVKQYDEWQMEDLNNLILLCRHYGIKEDHPSTLFFKLSIALAKELGIPAFVEKKPVGRKKKWTDSRKAILVVEVESLKEKHGVSWAADLLAKKEPWKSLIETQADASLPNSPGEVLRQIYYDNRNTESAVRMRDIHCNQMKIYTFMKDTILENYFL